jgi:membrane-bound lytic murein transglycosylase B
VELDKKQPEKKLTYSEYRRLIKIDNKIERAKIFYRDNKTLIGEIGEKYGVEPEIIVALIALESDLGEVQGNFNIVDALASLSFEGRRKSFFEKELINILKISYSENVPYENLKGSWAGAMGQCQFMPSNYVAYAVDHAADGFKDIWNDKADVFASAANYLKQNGWKHGNSSVSLISSKNLQKKEYSICKNAKNCQLDKNNLLITVNESDKIDAIYKVGSNYNVLMKWNRSSYFVISALKIAAGINIG